MLVYILKPFALVSCLFRIDHAPEPQNAKAHLDTVPGHPLLPLPHMSQYLRFLCFDDLVCRTALQHTTVHRDRHMHMCMCMCMCMHMHMSCLSLLN